ncbi:HAD-IA family hydrolase [soil metagenome]
MLFDAGGTLVQVHVERLAAALRERGCDPFELDDAFWRTLAMLDSEFGPSAGGWESWFDRWLDHLAGRSRVPSTAMREAWRAADRELHLWDLPVPGAAECLRRLREAGLRLGVVSNADGRIAGALRRAGLDELVEVVVDSGVVDVAKPDPRIFSHALGPLGLAPEETWYVGDTVVYDAAGARAAGLVDWLVDHRGLQSREHPRRVSSLAEFADAVLTARARGPG